MRGVTVRGNPTFTWSGQQRPIRLRRLVQKERENVVSQKLGQRRVEPEGAGCEAEVGCGPGERWLPLQMSSGSGSGVARGDAARPAGSLVADEWLFPCSKLGRRCLCSR